MARGAPVTLSSKGDTVVVSSTPIPVTGPLYQKIGGDLIRRGVTLLGAPREVDGVGYYVSGHAARDEYREILHRPLVLHPNLRRRFYRKYFKRISHVEEVCRAIT